MARSYRTPTLNELYRGFRVGNIVTNANPLLEPERLTSVEGGVLVGHGRASVRVTAFHNVLDEAISNITLSSTPALITRERQNADQLGSSGVEVEGDVRPHPRVTLSAFRGVHLGALHRHAEAARHPGQPRAAGAEILDRRGRHRRDPEDRDVLRPGPVRRLAVPRTI